MRARRFSPFVLGTFVFALALASAPVSPAGAKGGAKDAASAKSSAAGGEVMWDAPIAADEQLAIQGLVGKITIRTTSGRNARVTATRRATDPSAPQMGLRTIDDKKRVTIQVVDPTGAEPGEQGSEAGVDFVVELPAGVAFSASTFVGSIDATLAGKSRPGDVSLRTKNGSIRVAVEGDLDVDLDASVTNGSLETQFPTVNGTRSENGWRGRIGDGGPKLELRSENGRVDLVRAS